VEPERPARRHPELSVSGPATVEYRRAGRTEALHRLSVEVADGEGKLVARAGEPGLRTYWRSAAKPFQAIPFLASGAAEAYGLEASEIALLCSSHSGEAPHRAAAARILSSAGLSEADLLCGAHWPLWPPGWHDLEEAGGRPSPLGNNCSGKHAGMLAYCRFRGWPLVDYRRPDHPLQVEILDVVRRASGEPAESIHEAVDGCGVPVFHLSLAGMATAYARLAAGAELPAAWQAASVRILESVASEPFYLAGTDRLCTRLVEVTFGRVIAKVGAMGIYCAVLRDRGWGLAIKVEDGASGAAAVGLVEALRQLDALEDDALAALAPFGPGPLANHAGTVVGEVEARFALA
jgi:L-asparaginase II